MLAVNFLSVIFDDQEINLAIYGIGYALPIAALAYFMKVRSHINENVTESQEDSDEGSSPCDEYHFKAMQESFEEKI